VNFRCALPSCWNHPLLVAGGLLLVLLAASPAIPAEPAGDTEQAANPDAGISSLTGTVDSDAKRHALSFGLAMLAGIIVGGTMLLVLVVVWGNRTRRLARSPLPPVSKRDELWFLKPKKDPGEGPVGIPETGPESEPEAE
jgi:hypothetical protein